MTLRLTRRNLLFMLIVLSVIGLFVYSKIGSRVLLLTGTALTSDAEDAGALSKIPNSGRNDELLQRNGLGMLPGDDDKTHGDDLIGVIDFPRRSAQEPAEIDEGADDDVIGDGSFASVDGKNVLVFGNHMRVGDNMKQMMKDEGLIEGVNVEGKKRRDSAQEEEEEEHDDEDEEGRKNRIVPLQIPVQTSTRNDAKVKSKEETNVKSKEETNGQVMVIDEKASLKSDRVAHKRVVKIGWTRDRRTHQPKAADVTDNTRRVIPSTTSLKSHYFSEHPEDAKAKKLYFKCLSKMDAPEKNAYLRWEHDGGRNRESLANVRMNIGERWVALSQYMHSLGREQRLPQVINIGAKKSGTTALGWFLNMHPQIAHSFGNEVHFFDKNYRKGLEYYKSRMSFAKRNQLMFEKTPRYLVTDSAPANALKDLSPDVKFIICIRDPLKRALSDFRHDSTLKVRRAHKMNSQVTNDRTPEGEGARFSAKAFDSRGKVNGSFDAVRTSSYVKHFKNWLSYYPREKFLIIDHQRLVDNAFHELLRIEKFLGLTPYFLESMFYYDSQRRGTCVKRPNRCPPRSSPGFLPKGILGIAEERKLRDYFRPLNREFVELVGDNNFTWVDL